MQFYLVGSLTPKRAALRLSPMANVLKVLLSRKAQACFGLLIRLPHQVSIETEKQLIHLLQLMLKVSHTEA
jgi:hypothetical protein